MIVKLRGKNWREFKEGNRLFKKAHSSILIDKKTENLPPLNAAISLFQNISCQNRLYETKLC